jgi:arylsulfatase A-like enzyme
MKRFWVVFGMLVGVLPLIGALYLYKTGMMLYSQVGLIRTLGVAGAFALAFGLVAALAAAAALALNLDGERPRLHRALRVGTYALVLANLALVGLVRFFVTPRLAPQPWLFGAAAIAVACLLAFVRYRDSEQRFILLTLSRLGRAALVVPLLATPLVAYTALTERPRLELPALAATAKPQAPRRIVVIGFDGLRARDTSLVDPAGKLTPALASLAQEATYFPGYRATSDRTLLCLPSVLSGLDTKQVIPWLDNASEYLRQGALPGLAGLLKPAGYRAYYSTMLINPSTFGMGDEYDGGFTTARVFYPNELNTRAFLPLGETLRWSLRKAFDTEFAPVHDDVRETRHTFEQAHRLLKQSPDRTFLWVHVAAPHFPYYAVPEADLDGELHTERYAKVTHEQAVKADPSQARRYEAVYRDYVRFADAELGRFVRGLKADGLWDDALVIVLSDHGESFVPGAMTHAFGSVMEDITHVPFLVHAPGQREGVRAEGAASHIDVVPTVLGQVYDQLPAHLTGDSLLAATPDAARTRIVWTPPLRHYTAAKPRWLAAYQAGYKYQVGFPDGRETLYDLARDPLAQHDIAAQQTARLMALRDQANRALAPAAAPSAPPPTASDSRVHSH